MAQDRIIISIPKPKIRLGNLRGWLPSKGNVAFIGIVVAALLFANRAGALAAFVPAAPAASTTTIPYQGRLANAGGNPLTGTYSMVFRLYSQVSGGSPLWEETWTGPNGVRVSDGLFNVMLGSLNTIPQAVVTGNANLWLGITVGVDSEMAPRVQLGTVPYAMQALTVPDKSITADKLSDGAVTSGKMALSHGTACLSANTLFTLPGNWQAALVPDLRLDFSLSVPSQVLVWFDGLASFEQATRGETDIALLVDGVGRTSSFGNDTDDYWFSVKGQRILNLGAGAHSMTVNANSYNQGKLTVHGGGAYQTCINYLVLGAP